MDKIVVGVIKLVVYQCIGIAVKGTDPESSLSLHILAILPRGGMAICFIQTNMVYGTATTINYHYDLIIISLLRQW